MIYIRFYKPHSNPPQFSQIAGPFTNAEEAGKAREVSGDLAVTSDNKIVNDTRWLFEWEKADPTCYAQRAMRTGRW